MEEKCSGHGNILPKTVKHHSNLKIMDAYLNLMMLTAFSTQSEFLEINNNITYLSAEININSNLLLFFYYFAFSQPFCWCKQINFVVHQSLEPF